MSPNRSIGRLQGVSFRRWSALNTSKWSVHSRRIEPIKRSTYPFCQGDRNDVGRSRIPIAWTIRGGNWIR
jgi:hypothetical protein